MNEKDKIIVPPRVAQINAEIARQGNKGYSVAPNIPPVINGDLLSGSETPMTLKTPDPLLEADGLLGAIKTSADVFQSEQQRKIAQSEKLAEAKTKTDTSRQTLMQRLGLAKGETERTEEEYSKTVDPLEAELNAANQEILQEEQRLRRQIEALDKQPGTIQQKQQIAYDLTKESAKYQADLYIKQMGLQGRYDSAKRIADRKIAVELEKEKRDLDLLKFDYEENKEIFTKEEQRDFDAMWDSRKRDLDAKEAKMKQFEDTRLALLQSANTQNAPLEVKTAILNAKTTEEAIQAAGQYAGDVLERQLKQQQLAESIAKTQQALNALPPAIQTKVQTIANQFDNEAIVKEYNTIATTLDAINSAGTTPTDDIQRIYAFAKIMDPNSVVREGEYKTVQEYAQALLQFAGLKTKRVFTNSGFLTDEAREFLSNTLNNRFKSTQKAYDNVYNEYGRRINKVTGRTDGSEYITDYRKAFIEDNGGVLRNPEGTMEVNIADLTPEELQEAMDNGWK